MEMIYNVKKYLVACVVFIFCLFASAAKTKAAITADNITVDYDNVRLIVNAGNEKEVLFGVSKVNNKNVLTTPNWNVYEPKDGKAVIDLTFLKRNQVTYMQVKGVGSKDPVTISVGVMLKFKAKLNRAKKELYVGEGISATGMEYRTVYSGIQELPESEAGYYIVPEMYWQRGATLYVRTAAAEDRKELLNHGIKDAAGNKLSILSIGRFPGKEVKVNIPKLKNGPKIAVNWTKRTITLPAKSEYRIKLSNQNQYGSWIDTGNKKLVLNEIALAEFIKNGGTIEARVKATSKNAASKISILSTVGNQGKTIEAVYIPETNILDVDERWTNSYYDVYKWEGISIHEWEDIREEEEDWFSRAEVRFGIPVTTEKGVPVIHDGLRMRGMKYFLNRSYTGGFTAKFENLSDVDSYQIMVETFGYDGDFSVDNSNLKTIKTNIFTIKPKAKKKITISISFYSNKYRLKRIKIRQIGTDKNKMWPTEYLMFGSMESGDDHGY